MNIHIINGPNLNLVGLREPEVYGNRSLDQYLQELAEQFPQHAIDVYQSNIEGEIVDRLQAVGFDADCGIVLNAGGYTHTSVAIADAVADYQEWQDSTIGIAFNPDRLMASSPSTASRRPTLRTAPLGWRTACVQPVSAWAQTVSFPS